MWIGSNSSIQAVPVGRRADLVQVGVVAVARAHVADRAGRRELEITYSPWPKPTSRIRPCHQVSTGWPLVLLDDLEVGRRLAGAAAV